MTEVLFARLDELTTFQSSLQAQITANKVFGTVNQITSTPSVNGNTLSFPGNIVLGPNSTIAANTPPLLDIRANPVAVPTPFNITTLTPTMRLVGTDVNLTTLTLQNFGLQNAFQAFVANGTALAPTAFSSGSVIFNVQGYAYDGANYGNPGPGANVSFQLQAAELQASAAHGTRIVFATTPLGSSLKTDAFFIQPSGGVSVGTATDTGINSISAIDAYTANTNFLLRTKATLANGSAAAAGTLTNAPVAGNPTKWISIDDNGTTRKIPAW